MADDQDSREKYFDKDEYFVGSASNYSRLPGGYNFLRRGLFWKGKINRIAKYMPAGRVLDIGCAYGYFLYFFKKRHYDIYGCDISPHAITTCKGLFKKSCSDHFFTHDITKPLPFPEEYFDVITCQDVIEHIPDIFPPLKNIYAALKPGGIFFLRIPIKTKYHATEILRFERDPTHISVLPEAILMKNVLAVGFTLLEKHYTWMGAIRLPSFIKFGSDIAMILQKPKSAG
ncbi:MAG TPA: class I SAM-dependent methyltransferase [Candidatus Lokiarchaeia archaeon]|nr:class I SAM-dependent methyltransferase [Candidatus Lokiarchaeia archaeon]